MWRRVLGGLRSWPVLVAAGLYGAYLLAGFFLVDPLARRLLPVVGEHTLASRLQAQGVEFNPFTLELRVQGLALEEPEGGLLAGFNRLYLNLDVAGITRWAVQLRTVEVDGPRLTVAVRAGGAMNWDRLVARLREDADPPSRSMVRLLVDQVRIANGHVLYTDADRPGEPFRAVFTPLGLELAGLSTLPEDRAGYLLAAKLPEQGGTLRWKGDVALNPLTSRGEVALEGARIDKLVRVVQSPLAAEPSGTLAATVPYRFALLRAGGQRDIPSLEVVGASLLLQGFKLAPHGAAEPLLQLQQARVAEAAFDLVRRQVDVGSVQLAGGKLAATRSAQGTLDWQALFGGRGTSASGPAADNGAGAGAAWKLAVRDIRFADWAAKWTDLAYARPLTASAEGFTLAASLQGELGAHTALVLGPVNASVGTVQLASGAQPVAQLRKAELVNARMELPGGRIRADALDLSGASTTIELDARQNLNWNEILRKAAQPPSPVADRQGTVSDVQIGRVRVDDIALRFVDASPAAPVTLDLAQGSVLLKDVSLDTARALPLEARFAVAQGGRFEGRGSLVPAKGSGQLDVRIADFSLKPFAPYVNRFARLRLESGAAGTRGRLAFGPGKSGPALAYRGAFVVDELAITEEDSGDPFLGWKKLSSDSLQVALQPGRVVVGELVALHPFGKVIIFEDQTLNLQRMRRTAPAATSPAGPDQPAMHVAIERLRIVGANAEFADLSLTPRFGTRMHELGGVITGLTTDPASVAQVELDGKVDEYGSARIRGSLQPFRASEHTDVSLAFRNLEMTRLTPYSGKFAGRRIESGRLSVDLEYKVRQRQLAGANKFVVTRLKLGDAVDSPGAAKLPLDLAIALLEDSNGVIDLDLPVSGSLDDPQFSYGALVWKAIVNVLTKLVTAPFRALGGLLGADAEKFASAGFDPGSSTLLPPEQEKLKALAEAMAKRPALTLTIEPGFDPQADRLALQEAAMRREAAAAMGVRLAAGEAPGPVDVNNHKVRTWLEDRYVQAAGRPDYDKLRASHQDPGSNAVQRAMDSEFMERLGRRFGTREAGAPSPLHTELLARLTARVPVDDEALADLARARGAAMRQAVVQLGLQEERVAIAAPTRHAAKDKLVASGLALGAGKAPAAGPPPTASVAVGDPLRRP